MTLVEFLLLIIVMGGAAYAGYVYGRASAFQEISAGQGVPSGDAQTPTRTPLPGPTEDYQPPRRSAAPPPASAGGEVAVGGSQTGAGSTPRRTATPPPARAGLLGGEGEPQAPRGPGGKPPKSRV